jgi:hypothetical protein
MIQGFFIIDQGIEDYRIVIDNSFLVAFGKGVPVNCMNTRSVPIRESHPVKKVQAILLLQALNEMNRTVYGTSAGSYPALVRNEHDKSIVKYYAFGRHLLIVAHPLCGKPINS